MDSMSSFLAELITIGRKSNNTHKVTLRFVYYNNKYYVSRRDYNSDWLKNILVNRDVKIILDNKIITCKAEIVKDQELCKKISALKYNDPIKASMNRVVVELTPYI